MLLLLIVQAKVPTKSAYPSNKDFKTFQKRRLEYTSTQFQSFGITLRESQYICYKGEKITYSFPLCGSAFLHSQLTVLLWVSKLAYQQI